MPRTHAAAGDLATGESPAKANLVDCDLGSRRCATCSSCPGSMRDALRADAVAGMGF